MHITTAASTYGPEYYQALLAQSEDEILMPKRTPGTQRGITYVRKLLDSQHGDVLISVAENEDEHIINAAFKTSAKGYGHMFLQGCSPNDIIGEEMVHVDTALAVSPKQYLRKDGRGEPLAPYTIDERRIYKAANVILDGSSLNKETVDPYRRDYALQKILG